MKKKNLHPERLVNVPFNKTQCGVDFYINTGHSSEICGVLTENPTFKTDFFEFSFPESQRFSGAEQQTNSTA